MSAQSRLEVGRVYPATGRKAEQRPSPEEIERASKQMTARLQKLQARGEEIVKALKIAEAAKAFLEANDRVLGPEWRLTTLNQLDEGDELNEAWDNLVEAIEG